MAPSAAAPRRRRRRSRAVRRLRRRCSPRQRSSQKRPLAVVYACRAAEAAAGVWGHMPCSPRRRRQRWCEERRGEGRPGEAPGGRRCRPGPSTRRSRGRSPPHRAARTRPATDRPRHPTPRPLAPHPAPRLGRRRAAPARAARGVRVHGRVAAGTPWGCAHPPRAFRSPARRAGTARDATGRTPRSCAPGRAAPRRAPPAAPQGRRAPVPAQPAVCVLRHVQ